MNAGTVALGYCLVTRAGLAISEQCLFFVLLCVKGRWVDE